MHTTNYRNVFIEVAEDCPVEAAEIPPQRGTKRSAAQIQFDLVTETPYTHTSDDVFFHVYALKKEVGNTELDAARSLFFSKGQPCFRASPLTQRYGWGVHNDAEGKVALYAVESDDYKRLAADETIGHVKAMRSKKA